MDVSTPPSLDLACPQAKADIEKYVHIFRDSGVDKIKYGHEGIMIILITATYIYIYRENPSYHPVVVTPHISYTTKWYYIYYFIILNMFIYYI